MVQPDLSTIYSHLVALYGPAVGDHTLSAMRDPQSLSQPPGKFTGAGFLRFPSG